MLDKNTVDEASMEAGVKLAEGFKYETKRVYALLGESDEEREQRQLIEFIERKDGSVTARDVRQGMRSIATAEEARERLESLVKAGVGSWHDVPTGPKGGRPTKEFRLSTPPASTQPHGKPHENKGVEVLGT